MDEGFLSRCGSFVSFVSWSVLGGVSGSSGRSSSLPTARRSAKEHSSASRCCRPRSRSSAYEAPGDRGNKGGQEMTRDDKRWCKNGWDLARLGLIMICFPPMKRCCECMGDLGGPGQLDSDWDCHGLLFNIHMPQKNWKTTGWNGWNTPSLPQNTSKWLLLGFTICLVMQVKKHFLPWLTCLPAPISHLLPICPSVHPPRATAVEASWQEMARWCSVAGSAARPTPRKSLRKAERQFPESFDKLRYLDCLPEEMRLLKSPLRMRWRRVKPGEIER